MTSSTLEAIMYSVRTGGRAALFSDANRHRLCELDDGNLQEARSRLGKFGISPSDIAAVVPRGRDLAGGSGGSRNCFAGFETPAASNGDGRGFADTRQQKRSGGGNGQRAPSRALIYQTLKDLRLKTFPPIKYIVPGLICEGVVLLAGKPKVGKSWLALDIALAVAADRFCLGDRKPVQGPVLYLALEDGERRMQTRVGKFLPTFGGDWPIDFHYMTDCPRADQGGVEEIDKWCEQHCAFRRRRTVIPIEAGHGSNRLRTPFR